MVPFHKRKYQIDKSMLPIQFVTRGNDLRCYTVVKTFRHLLSDRKLDRLIAAQSDELGNQFILAGFDYSGEGYNFIWDDFSNEFKEVNYDDMFE